MDRVSVWGRVVDAEDQPPPRSIVYWVEGNHQGPALPQDLHPIASTDVGGHFFGQDLPTGNCILLADCEAYAAGLQGARSSQGLRVSLPLPEGEREVVLQYPFSRKSFLRIRGTIVAGEDKRPLRGHRVALLDTASSGRKFRMETDTDRDGEFRFEWVPPGKYSIGVPGTMGRLADGYNIQNALPGGVDIPVEIGVARRPPGGPRHGATVRCVDETGAPLGGVEVAFRATNHHFLPVLTGEDGIARAEGFPAPLIGAMATKVGHMTFAGPLEVGEGGVPGGRFVLRKLVTVRVIAIDDATGTPVRRARIAADFVNGWMPENIDGILRPPKVMSSDGGFDLQVLPGEVTFRATFPGYRMGEMKVEVPSAGLQGPVEVGLPPVRLSC